MARRAAAWALLALLALLELAAAKPMHGSSNLLRIAADVGPWETPRGSDADSPPRNVPRRKDGTFAIELPPPPPPNDIVQLPPMDQYGSSPRSTLADPDNESQGGNALQLVTMFRRQKYATSETLAQDKCWERSIAKWWEMSQSGRELMPSPLRSVAHLRSEPFSTRSDADLNDVAKKSGLLARQSGSDATLLDALREFGLAREAATAAAAQEFSSAHFWGDFAASKARRARQAIAKLPEMPCGIVLERPLHMDLISELRQIVLTAGSAGLPPSVDWRDLMVTKMYRCDPVSQYYGLSDLSATATLDACNVPLAQDKPRLVLRVIADGCRAPGLFMDSATEIGVLALRPSPDQSFDIVGMDYFVRERRLVLQLWQHTPKRAMSKPRAEMYNAVNSCVRNAMSKPEAV